MSTYKTPKGNVVEVNWRNHESKGPADVDYLLDQVDAFVDATRASRNDIDNISVVYHVTKNKPRVVKSVAAQLPPEQKSVVKKVIEKVTGKKKTTKKK